MNDTWESLVSSGLDKLFKDPYMQHAIEEDHVKDTPERYVKALKELFVGVSQSPRTALATLFPANSDKEMIHVKEITFFSVCAHHLVPFFGKMNFAYIPTDKIVGLSKIPRLVEVYARRPQVQESLTSQIVNAFQEIVNPQGCAIMVRAYHMCCASRGIKQPTSYTETTALRGVFTMPNVKSEFLYSCNSSDFKVF